MNLGFEVVHTPSFTPAAIASSMIRRIPGPHRQARDELGGDLRLGLVQREDQLVFRRGGLGPRRPAELVEVGPHALLAAGDEQQPAVEVDVPFGVDAHLLERQVEAHPMRVALGVDEHAVAIENQRLDHPSAAP
jgi:hypothetical protein